MKNAYFLSHNGLGDNITNIGAVRFLLQYYDTIYFLCKDIYQENVRRLFVNQSVITIPFDHTNEFVECKRIIENANYLDDLFISGVHKHRMVSRITHPELLQYRPQNHYTLHYKHISDFYEDIGLDTTIYVSYFKIDSTEISERYYQEIQHYKIVFLHTKGSNRSVNLSEIVDIFKPKDDYIIICANENVYDMSDPKHAIADNYVNIPVADYIDIIQHSTNIYVINSCFSCIVYPLLLSNTIPSLNCNIYDA
jgi:hypothetical protein